MNDSSSDHPVSLPAPSVTELLLKHVDKRPLRPFSPRPRGPDFCQPRFFSGVTINLNMEMYHIPPEDPLADVSSLSLHLPV